MEKTVSLLVSYSQAQPNIRATVLSFVKSLVGCGYARLYHYEKFVVTVMKDSFWYKYMLYIHPLGGIHGI